MIKCQIQILDNVGPRAQDPGSGVMIGRCSLDSEHGRSNRHPANVGCSFFRYTNGDLRNLINQRPKRKALKTNNLHYTAILGVMMEIWLELTNFQTSQRFADQVRTIIKKGWFSDLDVIEIHQKINDHQSCNNT